MTIKSSASALVDDFVNSGSWLATEVSACDYGLIELGACGVVIQPGTNTMEVLAFGGIEQTVWSFDVRGFVADDQDVEATATRVYDMIDAMREAVAAGTCTNTGNRTAHMASIEYNPDVVYDLGGREYRVLRCRAEVREDP